nr:hypothetical protein [Tanacetum cinerariifolium]
MLTFVRRRTWKKELKKSNKFTKKYGAIILMYDVLKSGERVFNTESKCGVLPMKCDVLSAAVTHYHLIMALSGDPSLALYNYYPHPREYMMYLISQSNDKKYIEKVEGLYTLERERKKNNIRLENEQVNNQPSPRCGKGYLNMYKRLAMRLRWDRRVMGMLEGLPSLGTCVNTNRNTTLSETQGVSLRITSGIRDSITTQTCEISKEEFNDFLTLYPIPSEYRVILHKSNQTIFDAPLGFIYQGSTLLVVPSSPLLLSCAKLMRLGRYPTSVCVFLDPILFLAVLKPSWKYEMDFRNFIYTEDDKDLAFFPKEPSSSFGIGSLSVLVNTEPLKANEEPVIQPVDVTIDSGESLKPELFVVHPGSVAARIKDKKCKIKAGSSRPPVKRKLAPRSSTSHATRAKTSFLKDDASFLIVFDDDEAVVDNAVNKRSRKLLQVIEKLRGKFNVMRNRERAVEEEYEGLQVKCETAIIEFEKNLVVVDLREKISVLITEVKEHKLNLDRMMLESQKRCRAYEHVANMKEPFDLSKKPPSLQRPVPSRTQVPLHASLKATPSSALVSNMMSPTVDASVMKPQSSPLH